MRQVCKKIAWDCCHNQFPSIQDIHVSVYMSVFSVYVCCPHTRAPVTNFNSVSSLENTQALVAMPPNPSSSGTEIHIYYITRRRGKDGQRSRQSKTGKEREKARHTCGYDDNSFPLGRGQKNNEEQAKELWRWRGMKIAAEASKWTQGGENPSGRYGTMVNSSTEFWEKQECFSVFCSLKNVTTLCATSQLTFHSPPPLSPKKKL